MCSIDAENSAEVQTSKQEAEDIEVDLNKNDPVKDVSPISKIANSVQAIHPEEHSCLIDVAIEESLSRKDDDKRSNAGKVDKKEVKEKRGRTKSEKNVQC